MMHERSSPATEAEIEALEELSSAGNFAECLRDSTKLLKRTKDPGLRLRLLFGMVLCASMLESSEALENALCELDLLPNPEQSRVLANLNRAFAEYELGRPGNALEILNADLATGFLEQAGWKIHKYRCLVSKGNALTALKRPKEALECLEAAHDLFPNGACGSDECERSVIRQREPSIQIARANCLLALDRFEDSYHSAKEASEARDMDMAALGLQYMAECRLWQARVPEALRIYLELKKRLPSKFVDEGRINRGIANCMNYLEKQRPSGKPS
jgi:tetratricopeptide (TPR) repeat protein